MGFEGRTGVAIVGGGFYGAFVATEIKTVQPSLDVTIIEKNSELFGKASNTHQGRFHKGYLQSADQNLAIECAENAGRFYEEFGEAVDNEVLSLYGIHQDSEISPEEYVAFCNRLQLPLREIPRPPHIFGEPIVAAFETQEKTFNSAKLKDIFIRRMDRQGVKVVSNFDVDRVTTTSSGLEVVSGDRVIKADTVFNVTFADINGINERSGLPKIPLRHDTFLHFVLDLPQQYEQTAASVIRGSYAMVLPSTFRHGHILVSDRHSRMASTTIDRPSVEVKPEEAYTIYQRAKEETTRYMPILGDARYRDYTLGTRSAYFNKDPRAYTSKAMVFENYGGLENYHTVLGGKVSCVFDIRESIRRSVR
jgi:glycine/D-amino acid oxidase-like deaminating enzyme